ncbi:MAG: tRNA (adenosine(37)-N6)-threonylcarbamoyltransferase complex dimerization subunit type 1 TsaB [Phycisphaerae bacterium]
MNETFSLAIETSCRTGGICLGRGDNLLHSVEFDVSSRHAVVLVQQLDLLLKREGLGPANIDEVYVSAGPGSFTGLRIGVTVARTLAQAAPGVRCVSVPTAHAVAENVRNMEWEQLAVIFDAKGENIFVSRFGREGDEPRPAEPATMTESEFLESTPRPVLLTGEGLGYHNLDGEGIRQAPKDRWMPTVDGVWMAGRRLAREQRYTEPAKLLPIYSRKPEAVRLWEKRQSRS